MCGGTHVKNTSEIRGLTVTKIKKVGILLDFSLIIYITSRFPPIRPILKPVGLFQSQLASFKASQRFICAIHVRIFA